MTDFHTKFEMFQSKNTGQWRWRLRAGNSRIIASSGESFNNKADCLTSIEAVRRHATSPIVILGANGKPKE